MGRYGVSRKRHSDGLLQYEPSGEFKTTGRSMRPTTTTMMLRLLRLLKYKQMLPPIVAADLRTLGPVHACSCGCTVFNIYAQFDNYEISWWALDGQCASCGNLVKVPCPVDKEEI